MSGRKSPPAGPVARDVCVDILVVGAGTGMAAALTARECGLEVLVVEKTAWVGGSLALSGGAFWMPANSILSEANTGDTAEQGLAYLDALVGNDAPRARREAFIRNGPAAVQMLRRMTPLKFFWDKGYADYHPENPGGSARGRSCESKLFDVSKLGRERGRLRPAGSMGAPAAMPVTSADYKRLNLMMRKPMQALPLMALRVLQGAGGRLFRRDLRGVGQALAGGLFAGLLRAEVPVWTRTSLADLVISGGRVTGAVVQQDGVSATVTARKGVILAAGGFDHNMSMRRKYHVNRTDDCSWGAEGNTGDAIELATGVGAATDLMDEAWWFPALSDDAGKPQMMLAERMLPGSFMVGANGRRFINECVDYMTVGQVLQYHDRRGESLGRIWLVLDQFHRNNYSLAAGAVMPRMALPKKWYEAGVAVRAADPASLARAAGIDETVFVATFQRFNQLAASGYDSDFRRGASAYDRYYGDPTVLPNPNLRPLRGTLYAVEVVLTDLGTCGGLRADEFGRVQRQDGSTIDGLYAIGNSAANVFGRTYPAAGATIGQGLTYGYIAARHAAAATTPASTQTAGRS